MHASSEPQTLQAQNELMLHLASHGVLCSAPLPATCSRSSHGRFLVLTRLPPEAASAATTPAAAEEGQAAEPGPWFPVRCLRFIPGRVMAAVEQTPALQRSMGAFMGRVAVALAGFDHPCLHGHQHDWHMMQAARRVSSLLGELATQLPEEKRCVLLLFNSGSWVWSFMAAATLVRMCGVATMG